MNVGQALQDRATVLGASAVRHAAVVKQAAAMTPAEQITFWQRVAASRG